MTKQADTTVTLELINKLRERTGVGMMHCKKALIETDGDLEKAVELLRKRGAAVAAARADQATAQGIVHAYIHPGSRIGVMVEINCETDFVARTESLQTFAADLCLHIAAMRPLYLSPEQVDPTFLEHEKTIFKDQLVQSGKPEQVINKIIEGKVEKLYSEVCLLKQSFVKNDQLTIQDLINELIAKTGENIKIRRFSRYEIGF